MNALNALAPAIGLAPACAVLRINRAGVYRDRARCRGQTAAPGIPRPRPRAPLALSEIERSRLLDVLYSERFADCVPLYRFRSPGTRIKPSFRCSRHHTLPSLLPS